MISKKKDVEVIVPNVDAEVETTHNRIAEVNTNTYVLQTKSNAALSDRSGVPGWLSEAIDSGVEDGLVDTNQVIADLETAINVLDVGVHQEITSVQNDLVSTNQLLTTNVSRLDNDVAGVITLTNTKVTEDEARATALTAIEAEFNNPDVISNSTVLNLINTTSDATETNATDITNLHSSFTQSNTDMQIEIDATTTRLTTAGIGDDGQLLAQGSIVDAITASQGDFEVRLQAEESVSLGTHFWDGSEPLRIGMKQYIDPNLTPEPNILGNVQTYMGGVIGWVDDTRLNSDDAFIAVTNLESETATSIAELQSQIDGEISNWFYTGAPGSTVLPESEWIADDTANGNDNIKTNHLGDLYYDSDTGAAYRYSAGWVWTVITDNAIILALSNADKAQKTADGKMTIWYDTTGTIWSFTNAEGYMAMKGDIVVSGTDNVMYEALIDNPSVASDWRIIRDTTNDQELADAVQGIAGLEETNDGVVVTFYQSNGVPSAMTYGDWLVDDTVDPVVSAYRYEDSNGKNVGTLSWIDHSNDILGKAFIDASKAQDTADGKIKTWYQVSPGPVLTSDDVGDLWVNTSTSARVVKVWDGSSWRDTSNTNAELAKEWAAGASSFITDPNTGAITGWNYADGSQGESTFSIAADHFYIENSANPDYRPFDVNGTSISFNGNVRINSIQDAGGNDVTIGIYKGEFTTANEPIGSEGDTYYNTTNSVMMYHNTTDWVSTAGADGVDGIDGTSGINGTDGTDGVSIIFKGSFSSHPSSPQDGWSYYNTTDKKSYVRQSGAWYQMTVDGTDGQDGVNGIDGVDGQDGADGLSIVWKGESATPPANPSNNWVYKDTDNNKVYIYNGTAWELMVLDGSDGTDGTNGVNGDDGLSVYITYHNSTSTSAPALPTNVAGTNNGWSTTATTSAIWMSQKVDDGTTSNWGAAIRIKGTDGAPGKAINYVFQSTSSKTTVPTISGTSAVPSGWSDSVTNTTSVLPYRWFSKGTSTNGGTTWTWGTPKTDTATQMVELKLYKKNDSSISTGGSYDFSTGTLSGYESGWSTSVPSLTSNNDTIYVTSTVVTGAKDSVVSVAWPTPVVYSRRVDGTDGSQGDTGDRGPGWYNRTITGTTWSDAEAVLATDGGPVVGDIVTLVFADGTSQAKKYNGSSWETPGLYLNGDMIVDGTISAPKINTTDLVVQNVSPGGTNPDFEIKADGTAGPIGNKNYNIYGADVYGSTLVGGTISGAAIEASEFYINAGNNDYFSPGTYRTSPKQVLGSNSSTTGTLLPLGFTMAVNGGSSSYQRKARLRVGKSIVQCRSRKLFTCSTTANANTSFTFGFRFGFFETSTYINDTTAVENKTIPIIYYMLNATKTYFTLAGGKFYYEQTTKSTSVYIDGEFLDTLEDPNMLNNIQSYYYFGAYKNNNSTTLTRHANAVATTNYQ